MRCYHCMKALSTDNATFCPFCGKEPFEQNAPHRLAAGTVLHNRYLIGNTLGEGGFGITYVGFDQTLDIKVAVKEYFPSGIANRTHTYSNEISLNLNKQADVYKRGKEGFLREAKSVAKFSNELGIVDVRDFFTENNTAYIVMEFLDGVNLNEHLYKNGVMEAEKLFNMMLPLMRSLEKIHKENIIHRDISPDNIMLLKNGTLKLMDFGAARQYSRDEEKSLSVVLKPGYAPYEQYSRKGKQGPWTDVYALCATIYKCITGKTPPDSLDRAIDDELKKPSELGVKIPENLEKTLMKGLALRQHDRLQSMTELIAAVEGNGAPKAQAGSASPEKSGSSAAAAVEYEDPQRTVAAAGNDVAVEQTAKTDTQEKKAKTDTPKEKKKRGKLLPIIIGAVAVVLAAAIVVGVVVFGGGSSGSSKKGFVTSQVRSLADTSFGKIYDGVNISNVTTDPKTNSEVVLVNKDGRSIKLNGATVAKDGDVFYGKLGDLDGLYKITVTGENAAEYEEWVSADKLRNSVLGYTYIESAYYVTNLSGFTVDGDYVYGYVAVSDGLSSTSNYQDLNYRIFRISKSGDSIEFVGDENVRAASFVLSDGWIYYSDNGYYYEKSSDNYDDERKGIYKIKTDGSEKTKILSDFGEIGFSKRAVGCAAALTVYGDKLYYINMGDDGSLLYRASLDGSDNEKLTDSNISMYTVDVEKNAIYFLDQKYGEIYFTKFSMYKLDLNNNKTEPVANSLISPQTTEIAVEGEYVYLINSTTGIAGEGVRRFEPASISGQVLKLKDDSKHETDEYGFDKVVNDTQTYWWEAKESSSGI